MNQQTCQMTIDFTPKSNWATYGKCGKTAKFKVSNPKMGVEYVCGIHARSLDKMFERTGQDIQCIPL